VSITSIIVIFASIWFIALLVALPIGVRTQDESGTIVPGTPGSAPVDAMIAKKCVWATIAALVISVPLCATIIWSGVSIRDLDFWHIM
jgi:predicted secreted protein